MFIIGTGNSLALTPPKYLYKGNFKALAAALATAIDTPKIALAPSLLLLGVPSSANIKLSISTCAVASKPTISGAITSLTFFTACNTPLPKYLALSPSRNSTAS